MRLIAAFLLLAAGGFADEQSDRAAIDSLIHSLRNSSNVSALFTADAENELNRLEAIELNMAKAAHMPWSEVGPPVLVIDTIRFVTADVAIANASEMQTGSTITSRLPVLFVMKREKDEWKIASLRLLSPWPIEISPPARR